MSRLDRIKVIAKTDTKTVYQLNHKLLLKVVQHDGYYKTYLKVLGNNPDWSTAAQYKFIAITSSDEISKIFNEIDQLEIMSLQVFSAVQMGDDILKCGMSFDSIFLDMNDIDRHIGVYKLFDKQNDLDDCILGGSPYLQVYPLEGETCIGLTLYRPLSLYELVE
jgi:hypothetical protein